MGFLDAIKKFFGGEAPAEKEASAEAPAAPEGTEASNTESQSGEEQPMQ
jgi:hypothetical protein